MDTHITEGHLSGAGAVQPHAPLELAGGDSEAETNSRFNDEDRAAVVASSATLHQPPTTTTTTTAPATTAPAMFHGMAGARSPSIALEVLRVGLNDP